MTKGHFLLKLWAVWPTIWISASWWLTRNVIQKSSSFLKRGWLAVWHFISGHSPTVLIYDNSLVFWTQLLHKNYLLFLLYSLITYIKGFFQILKEISPLFIVNHVIDEHTNCDLLLKSSSYISWTDIMCKCLISFLRYLFRSATVWFHIYIAYVLHWEVD